MFPIDLYESQGRGTVVMSALTQAPSRPFHPSTVVGWLKHIFYASGGVLRPFKWWPRLAQVLRGSLCGMCPGYVWRAQNTWEHFDVART